MSENQEKLNPSSPPNGFMGEPSAPQTHERAKKAPSKPNKGKGAEGDGEEE